MQIGCKLKHEDDCLVQDLHVAVLNGLKSVSSSRPDGGVLYCIGVCPWNHEKAVLGGRVVVLEGDLIFVLGKQIRMG